MKKFWLIPAAALSLLTLTLAGLPAGAQQGKDEQLSSFSDLTWEIVGPDKEVMLLEPVRLALSLCNKSQRRALGHSAVALEDNHVELFVVQPGGGMKKISPLTPVRKQMIVRPQVMTPGECFRSAGALTLSLEKYFPEAGAYSLQAVIHDAEGNGRLWSNVVSFRVVEPAGANRRAYEFMKETDTADFLLSGAGFPDVEKKRKLLEKFTSDFGETVYSDYAALLLGEVYFYKGEYGKAGEQFDKVAPKADFVFAGAARAYLQKIKDKSKPDPSAH